MQVAAEPIPVIPAPGLSAEQILQIAEARLRWGKIRRGVAVALFDGWTIAIFAGLTLLGGLFNWIGLVLGAGMATVAYIELRGAKRCSRRIPN